MTQSRSSNTPCSGFTLIELLAVLGIVSILSAIAMQSMVEARKKAFDARAMTDLHNLASAEEAYFSSNETYRSCSDISDCAARLPAVSPLSPGTELAVTATTSGFTGTATHPNGTGRVYEWSSGGGGLLR
jgi:prepilin-type N-terminal cleavage/methylation domain-containing protein